MPEFIPKRPVGSSAEARFMQAAWDRLWGAGRMVSGPGIQLSQTTRGIKLTASMGGGLGKSLKRFVVTAVAGDYLTCHEWDGDMEGATDIFIAKGPELRHSLTAETIDGEAVTYSAHAINGYGTCTRTASRTGYADQSEMVIPTWQLFDSEDPLSETEIWAFQPEGGTGVTKDGVALTWLDANVCGRVWCQTE